jgi:hypothetical protein
MLFSGGTTSPPFSEKKMALRSQKEKMAIKKTLKTLCEVFGASVLPLEVEEALEKGHRVTVWHPRWEERLEMIVQDDWPPWKMDKFFVPSNWPGGLRRAPSVMVEVQEGAVWAEVASGLFLRGEVAYLRTSSKERLDEALEGVRFLRPFLAEMGLSDLEGALETLSQLEEGEIRQEGSYVLARKRDISDIRVLRRGGIFGDPLQDGAFLAGETVSFSFPQGGAFALQGHFYQDKVGIERASARWRGAEVNLAGGRLRLGHSALDENLASHLLRAPLKEFTENVALSIWISALAEEVLEHDDPLKALTSEEVLERVPLRALAKF